MDKSHYWRSVFARRMSRRRILRGAATGGLGLAAAGALGCGEEQATPTTATPTSGAPSGAATGTATAGTSAVKHNRGYTVDEVKAMSLEQMREAFHGKYLKDLWPASGPQYGGILNENMAGRDWDPTSFAAINYYGVAYYHNQLVSYEMGDFANPHFFVLDLDLAQSYEQVDNLTLVFKVHDNVYFQDVPPVNGRKMTAEDVKYAYEVLAKAPVQSGTFIDVQSIEAVDATTLRFKFREPAGYFLGMLQTPNYPVFPREQHEAGIMDKGPIGTGAFIHEWAEVNVGLKARKNPNYFKVDKWTGKKLPYLDRIEGVFRADIAAQIAAFRTKQFDWMRALSPEMAYDIIKTNPDAVIQFLPPPTTYQPVTSMNLANEPWSDVRVRRALSLAIDRDLLITSVASGWASYGNPLPWHFFGQEWPFEPEQLGQWYQYNPERAKEMLKEAGYEGGFKTDVVTTTTTLVGTYGDTWQTAWDMWKKNLGVEVSVSTVPDFAALTKMYTSVEYPNLITYGVVVGGATDPHNYVDPTRSDSPANYWHLKDAKIDELVLKQRRELDPEKRRQILMEWFNYETDNVLRMWTTNFWALIFRQPNVYNAWSQTDMWGLGGAGSAKVKERVWKAA